MKKITLFRGGRWIRARDWNWHNVLGFWCLVPLFLIVITGVIMSYAWANNLLYHMTGNAPPPQSQPAQSLPERSRNSGPRATPGHGMRRVESSRFEGLEKLFARAGQQVPDFTTISLRLPNPPANTLTFTIDRGNGGRPDLRSQLTLDRATGEIVRWEAFFQLQPRTATARVGPASPTPGRLEGCLGRRSRPCVCRRFIARVYRTLAWRAPVLGLEGTAGQGLGPLWFLRTQFLVFSCRFSVYLRLLFVLRLPPLLQCLAL